MVGFWDGCKSGTQNVLNETLVFVVNEVRENFHNFGMSQNYLLSLGWNHFECYWKAIVGGQSFCVHCEPASPSTNSRAGPCRESWEMIEGNPLNLKIGKM